MLPRAALYNLVGRAFGDPWSIATKPPLHKIVRQERQSVTKSFTVVLSYEKNPRVIGVVQSDREALSKSVNHFCVIPH